MLHYDCKIIKSLKTNGIHNENVLPISYYCHYTAISKLDKHTSVVVVQKKMRKRKQSILIKD